MNANRRLTIRVPAHVEQMLVSCAELHRRKLAQEARIALELHANRVLLCEIDRVEGSLAQTAAPRGGGLRDGRNALSAEIAVLETLAFREPPALDSISGGVR
jgi:hypothetical protein